MMYTNAYLVRLGAVTVRATVPPTRCILLYWSWLARAWGINRK